MYRRLFLSFQLSRVDEGRTQFLNQLSWSKEECLKTLGFTDKDLWVVGGKVVGGVGQASFFTQLEWVQKQCIEKAGFRPYPGTLNVEVNDEDTLVVERLRRVGQIQLVPPDPQFCAATLVRVNIGNIQGAIVVPEEDVNVHGKKVIEILAPVRLRKALGVKEGDEIILIVEAYT